MKLFGRRQRPMTQRIAEAEETLRLAEIQARTARARAEQEVLNQIAAQDPERALLLLRPQKYRALVAVRDRQGGSALQEVLEQAEALRKLQEALAPEPVEPVEVPDDTPGWLAALLNSPLGQGIGAGVGAAIQQAILQQQTQQATPAPTAGQPQVAPPAAPEQLAAPAQQPEPGSRMPPLGRLQAKAILVMLERRSPEDMAGQLLRLAGSMPALVEVLNTALALSDEEAMAILGELADEPGWEPVIGWLISHRDYTLQLLSELRRLVEAGGVAG
ncbi:MAG: hypothetical protein ACM3US_07320 [Sphingomonadaceae bacterium]